MTTVEQSAELMMEYERTYSGWADQVRHVRRDVAEHLDKCPAADDAVLVTSEIATNSILHSGSRGRHFRIRVQRYRDCLRVECQDAGGVWRGGRRDDDRPHGLAVVEALTGGPAGWGVQTTGDGGRIVWARLTW
jgi:anti-sigma regulatory factor (Ser/Thr protein kinase)